MDHEGVTAQEQRRIGADDQNRRDHHRRSHCPGRKKSPGYPHTGAWADVQYEKQVLVSAVPMRSMVPIRLLNYLQSQDISFGRVFSELPTLNDVFFLEITGKQLRD